MNIRMRIQKINPFIAAYVGVLVLLAGLGYLLGDIGWKQVNHEALMTSEEGAKAGTIFYDLPHMSFTMATSSGQIGRVRMALTLEVASKYRQRMDDYQPRISDRIIGYVRGLDAADITKPSAMPWLRRSLLREVNIGGAPVPIVDVVFREFLVL